MSSIFQEQKKLNSNQMWWVFSTACFCNICICPNPKSHIHLFFLLRGFYKCHHINKAAAIFCGYFYVFSLWPEISFDFLKVISLLFNNLSKSIYFLIQPSRKPSNSSHLLRDWCKTSQVNCKYPMSVTQGKWDISQQTESTTTIIHFFQCITLHIFFSSLMT